MAIVLRMSNYSYVAVDAQGTETRGILEVSDLSEAIRRIKEMGLFPTKVLRERERKRETAKARGGARARAGGLSRGWFGGRVKAGTLAVFTRQLATLLEAGVPLVRGLRILEQQEESRGMKRVIGELLLSIENGGSLAEGLGAHPRVFNRLYVNMIRAGEAAGALEVTLNRLAEFMEKAARLKGKIKTAMFYPCSVLVVAVAILMLLMGFVVPRFREVFDGLFAGAALPAFTTFVFNISRGIQHHFLAILAGAAVVGVCGSLAVRTRWGRCGYDRLRLAIPVLGALNRKAAISRFARTLGTLMGNGVPVLQALTIVKDTVGNVTFARVISEVHDRVREGDPIAPTLKESPLFPAMVAGMVDVGEQTGALPEMFMKIADTYEEQVDNATTGLTALLEPIMLVFLAVVVGSIVVAMFWPIVRSVDLLDGGGPNQAGG